jgi:hypothetical protein
MSEIISEYEPSLYSIPRKGTVLYTRVRSMIPALLEGTVVSIDPSCGSSSSMPAYAIYWAGRLLNSGTIQLDIEKPIEQRLYDLGLQLRSSITDSVGVLIYEDVPPVRFYKSGRTSAGSQSSLIKSVGTILGTIRADHHVGLRPSVWRRISGPSHVKGDVEDAIEMGRLTIELARYIQATHPPRSGRGRERRSGV